MSNWALSNISDTIDNRIRVTLLPTLILLARLWLLVLSAATLSTFTVYQLARLFNPGRLVTLPVFFTLMNIDEEKAYGLPSFRQSSLLQANFSLLGRQSLAPLVHHGTDYDAQLVLELPDSETNYSEGMFMLCMRLYDLQGNISWPNPFYWEAEVPNDKYGKCRSSILTETSMLKKLAQLTFGVPGLIWDPWGWRDTKVIIATLDDHFELNHKETTSRGTITILSYQLQVASSTLMFIPKMTFLDRHPIFMTFIGWCMLFFIWASLIIGSGLI